MINIAPYEIGGFVKKYYTLLLFSILISIFFVFPALAKGDTLLDAMQAELDRTNLLKEGEFEPPYFISYSVYDYFDWGFEAEFGGLMSTFNNKTRRGFIDVRVGDYSFDNTIKSGVLDGWIPDADFDRSNINLRIPIDDHVDAIRTQLWLVTDTMFKAAVADYLRKKGRRVYMLDKEVHVDDFTRERPSRFIGKVVPWKAEADHWKGLVLKASALFKEYPKFTRGHASVTFSNRVRRMTSTEGTRVLDGGSYFVFQVYAETQAEDGQKIQNFYNFYCRSESTLPGEDEVMKMTRKMADDLVALAKAEKLAPYSGPAILDPSLAGVFFHEAVGHRLEGERQEDTDEGGTFKGKIGEQILPEFISLIDDPTLKTAHGNDLFGNYLYDDQGVPSQKVVLVKNGILKNFLLSRSPIEGFNKSNGHGRGDGTLSPVARMGSTIVLSSKTTSFDKLKEKLIEIAKEQGRPFALILRQAEGGETITGKYNFQAFRHKPILVYKVDVNTGAETLVRGLEVVGTPLVSLNKIVTAGDDPEVFNGYCGAESGWVPVSVIAPSLLISEIELQRTSDKPIRPPILPAPFAK